MLELTEDLKELFASLGWEVLKLADFTYRKKYKTEKGTFSAAAVSYPTADGNTALTVQVISPYKGAVETALVFTKESYHLFRKQISRTAWSKGEERLRFSGRLGDLGIATMLVIMAPEQLLPDLDKIFDYKEEA